MKSSKSGVYFTLTADHSSDWPQVLRGRTWLMAVVKDGVVVETAVTECAALYWKDLGSFLISASVISQ